MSASWSMRRSFIWIVLAANVAVFLLYRFQKDSMRIALPAENIDLPILATLEPFSLTRENGNAFSSNELEGSPWIADFIFTRCPNQCPAMTARLAALQKSLPSKIRIVSFSVDPKHDSPDMLKSYADKFEVDPSRWIFLTGNQEDVRRIRSDFKLGKSGDPALHSLRFVLVDERSRVRGYYDSEAGDSLSKLLEDARKLLKHHE